MVKNLWKKKLLGIYICMLLIAVVFPIVSVGNDSYKGGSDEFDYKLVLVRVDISKNPAVILPRGVEVVGDKSGEWVDIVIPDYRLGELSNSKLVYSVLTQDLELYYEEMRGQYHTLAEIESILSNIASTYPSITSLYSIGTTYEGRDIWCLEITDNPGVDEGEPGVFYIGLHHANEWPTVEICLYIANQLTSRYGTDPDITNVVNHRRLWLVPCMNPDGYYYSHDVLGWPLGLLWRKNRHYFPEYNTFGVDLNRNYNGSCDGNSWGAWGSIGSADVSHAPYNDTYCGPGPNSEPEAQAIASVFLENDICASITWHTYGQLVLWPWSYTTGQTSDNSYLAYVGTQIAERITTQYGIDTYTPQQQGQNKLMTGNMIDWIYSYSHYVQGRATFAYLIEACFTIAPLQLFLDQICAENFDGALYLLQEAENIRNSVVPRVLPPVINNMTTDPDGDYQVSWQEQNPDPNSGKAQFWVETPDDIENDQKVWLYYGNPSAPSLSNGLETFPYFDHWTTDNTGDWLSGTPHTNHYTWWENTKSFTSSRALESTFKMKDWNAGTWDYTALGWTIDKSSHSIDVEHVMVQWYMKTEEGATDDICPIRLHIKKDGVTYEGNYTYVPRPYVNDRLSLSLMYDADKIRYEWKNLDTGLLLASDEITDPSRIPSPSNVPYLFHNEHDAYGGVFYWESPTFLRWGNDDGNGDVEFQTDNWFIRNYTSLEPSWGTVGSEENQSGGSQNWWNTDWMHRKLINVSDASNGYQMEIAIGYNSGGDVSCGGHCQSDFDDIRFIDYDNNTELDFWLEEYTDSVYFQLDELTNLNYSTDDAEKGKRDLIWSYTTDELVFSSPAVADGRVYVGSDDDKVYCLDADNGSFIWSYTTGGDVFSSPAVADGRVYAGSYDDKVYCLDADNGSLIWNYTTGWFVFSSPAVADGRVYVGSWDDKVYCLNADNGSFIWSYTTGDHVLSSPAVAGGRVYVGSWDDKVYCLDADNGSFIWSYTTDNWVDSSPAVAGGRVYVGSYDDKVYCLDADNGSLIWNYTTGGDVRSSPAVAGGRVYVGSYDDKVYCLDADNGSFIWSYTTGGDVFSSPAVADGRVYAGSLDNKVYCLDAVAGSLIWSYTTDDWVASSPAVADGRVYVGSDDDKLYCFFASRFWSFDGFDVSDSKSHSGNYSFKSRDSNEDVSAMTTMNPIPITEGMNLSFWCWYIIEYGWDYAFVEVSIDGRYYEILDSFTGSSSGWTYNDYPLNDFVNESVFFRFRYTTDETVLYDGFFVDDVAPIADFGSISTISDSLINTDCSIINKPHGAYYYRVRGHNTERGWGDFSTLESIYVDKPPNKPTMDGPTSGHTHIEYNYTAITTDPDGDNISYGWDWDGDLIVDNWTTWYGSGENCTTSHSWENSGYYNVSVKVKDIYKMESNWSDTLSVLINSPPHMPSNPLPPDNATGVPVITNLSWTGGDPDGDPVTNDLYFGDSSPPPKIMNNLTNTSYNLSGLENGTKYYWQIVSWDGFGASTSGPIWIFSTVDYMQPEWRNQGQNKTTIHPWESISLYAQGKDNTALDWAWLATNETGVWQNFTGGTGSWWDSNWQYRKELNVDNPSPGYQMFITVYKEDGHDDASNGIIDCEDHCNLIFSDIRFIDQTHSTSLAYWIEETGTDGGDHYADIWVNTSGENQIYMYYRNPSATPVNDGESTFLYFDHWTSDNTGDWISAQAHTNHYHWWENTKSFDSGRVFEQTFKMLDWHAGDWDYTAIGWTLDRSSHWYDYSHVAVQWYMRTNEGATDSICPIRLHLRNGTFVIEGSYTFVSKPDPNDLLHLKLTYEHNKVSYELRNLDTGVLLASDEITNTSYIPPTTTAKYLFHNQHDVMGGHFYWESPTFLRWGNEPYNGDVDFQTDYWFIRNYLTPGSSWASFGTETTMVSGTAGSWWDSNWQYRKELNVDNPSPGYQMFITVYKEDGHDDASNGIIDCEDHCNLIFSDIRFIDQTHSTSLAYWIEETGTDGGDHYADIWVNTSGDDTIYIYYGNPDAIPISNGNDVFPYFDHWTTDNTGDWIHGEPSNNHHQWWEDTKSFTTYRALESKSTMESWNAGSWDASVLGWIEDKTSHWSGVNHVVVLWSMKTSDGASDSTVPIRLSIKNGDINTVTPYISVSKPDPNHELCLILSYSDTNVSYEWMDLDTGTILASDSITNPSAVPSPTSTSYLFFEQFDSAGGIFSWLSPTYLKWGNQPYNGGCEWYVDYWFIRNYTSIEPSWNIFGDEQVSSGGYGSPIKLEENNQWQWSNFTWQNSSVPNGTVVGWRIYYSDTSGNDNSTDIMSFEISGKLHIADLKSEWNFISLPFNQSVNKSNLIIKYNDSEYTWSEAVSNNTILDFIYEWNRTNQNYELVDTLNPGFGCWMYAYEDCELWATVGRNITEDNFVTDLLATWNIVGLPDDETVHKENLTIQYNGTDYTWQQAVDNGTILDFIYEWNETNQNYEYTDILHPGKGCWMYAYYNCTLLRPVT